MMSSFYDQPIQIFPNNSETRFNLHS